MTHRPGTATALLAVGVFLAGCRGPVASALDRAAPPPLQADARACDRGDMFACTNVGAALVDGDDVPADPEAGAQLLRDACAGSAWLACVLLARGAPPAEALRLLDRACAGGFGPGCLALGAALAGVDAVRAVTAWQDGCEAGTVDACFRLAVALREAPTGHADGGAADRLLADACTRNHAAACRERVVALPRTERLPGLQRACALSDAEACALVAAAFADAEATTVERESAGAFRRRACELGWATACVDGPR